MGLILDSSEVIAGERAGLQPYEILERIHLRFKPVEIALSVISVMELEHGIWRAQTVAQSVQRQEFCKIMIASVRIYPVTTSIAQRAAKIQADCRSNGTNIAALDILIGATALEIGYPVLTSNIRHFEAIPNLIVLRS